jgi:hypothetical protein
MCSTCKFQCREGGEIKGGEEARSMIMLASALDLSKLSSPTLYTMITRRRASAVALNPAAGGVEKQACSPVSIYVDRYQE